MTSEVLEIPMKTAPEPPTSHARPISDASKPLKDSGLVQATVLTVEEIVSAHLPGHRVKKKRETDGMNGVVVKRKKRRKEKCGDKEIESYEAIKASKALAQNRSQPRDFIAAQSSTNGGENDDEATGGSCERKQTKATSDKSPHRPKKRKKRPKPDIDDA